MLRTVSDPLDVVNEGSLRLEKTTGNDKESCDLGVLGLLEMILDKKFRRSNAEQDITRRHCGTD
jgi:hypothetical protein